MKICRRKIKLFLLFCAFFLSSSCGSVKIEVDDLPVPPYAEKGNKYPEFGTQVQLSITGANYSIKERIGKTNGKLYTFSKKPVTWQELAEFYDPELAKKGFSRKKPEPLHSVDSWVLFYEDGAIFNKKGIAVLLIEAVDYTTKEKYYFLWLAASED